VTGGAADERASTARAANHDREAASFDDGGGEVIAVVGAGRSGTSATARAVGALGIELGDRLKPGTRKNAKGFFEDEDLLDINYRLRDHFGIKRSGSTVTVIHGKQLRDDPVVDRLRAEATQLIGRRFGGCRRWGFKSGGTIAFLPFWEDVFRETGFAPSYVLALRNPLAVARSRARLSTRRGPQERSDLEWLVRNIPYFTRIARRPLAVVDLDLLMSEPVDQLERMARKLGVAVDDSVRDGIREYAQEFLSAELRHNLADDDELDRHPTLNPLARDAYRLLRGLASDTLFVDDPRFQADWAALEKALANMEPVLRYVDQLEREVRRSRWTLSGAYRAVMHDLPRLKPELFNRNPG
jgi:hypothetical protein